MLLPDDLIIVHHHLHINVGHNVGLGWGMNCKTEKAHGRCWLIIFQEFQKEAAGQLPFVLTFVIYGKF